MSFTRVLFSNLGQTFAQGIGAVHATQQARSPQPQRGKSAGPTCTPCAARAMVAAAKGNRPAGR